jgi:stage II sporulation protein R
MNLFQRCAALFCALLLAFGLCTLLPVHGEAAVYDEVVRLHVLTNSDSDTDQAHKLAVRDAVLQETRSLLAGVSDREQAESILEEALPALEQCAREVLTQRGCSAPVRAVLVEEDYPTRLYGERVFPAGTYRSLQIRLGDAAGQNWWCVLYPSLCLSQATGKAVAAGEANAPRPTLLGLTDRQYTILTGTEANVCEVRLKILETLESWIG